jgi:hypothetical protein
MAVSLRISSVKVENATVGFGTMSPLKTTLQIPLDTAAPPTVVKLGN